MINNSNKEIRKKTFHVQLKGTVLDKLEEMIRYYSANSSEMFRKLINDFYADKYKKEVVGYHGGMSAHQNRSKRINRDEEVKRMAEMSDYELTEYLKEIGYFPSQTEYLDDRQDVEVRHLIVTDPATNEKNYEIQHWRIVPIPNQEPMQYRYIAYNFNELINALKKEKFI